MTPVNAQPAGSRFTGLANSFDAAAALAINPKGGAGYVTGPVTCR